MEEPTYTEAAVEAGARAVRQLYIALTKEGFTAAQAMDLVRSVLLSQLGKGS